MMVLRIFTFYTIEAARKRRKAVDNRCLNID